MAYTIELSPDEEKIVQRRAARLGITPQEYLRRSVNRHLRPSHPSTFALRDDEKQALIVLNNQLPTPFWERYAALTAKVRERTLTEAEHTEIKALAAQEEDWSVKRLQFLQSLAQKRHTSLVHLMRYNGIRHHPDAGRLLTRE